MGQKMWTLRAFTLAFITVSCLAAPNSIRSKSSQDDSLLKNHDGFMAWFGLTENDFFAEGDKSKNEDSAPTPTLVSTSESDQHGEEETHSHPNPYPNPLPLPSNQHQHGKKPSLSKPTVQVPVRNPVAVQPRPVPDQVPRPTPPRTRPNPQVTRPREVKPTIYGSRNPQSNTGRWPHLHGRPGSSQARPGPVQPRPGSVQQRPGTVTAPSAKPRPQATKNASMKNPKPGPSKTKKPTVKKNPAQQSNRIPTSRPRQPYMRPPPPSYFYRQPYYIPYWQSYRRRPSYPMVQNRPVSYRVSKSKCMVDGKNGKCVDVKHDCQGQISDKDQKSICGSPSTKCCPYMSNALIAQFRKLPVATTYPGYKCKAADGRFGKCQESFLECGQREEASGRCNNSGTLKCCTKSQGPFN